MQTDWNVIQATLQCSFKAWNLALENSSEIEFSVHENIINVVLRLQNISAQDKLVTIAWFYNQDAFLKKQVDRIRISAVSGAEIIKISKPNPKAEKLLSDAIRIIKKIEPPAFYRNSHCPECRLRETCLKKLKERDCISLLGGMTGKILDKYHKKGIFSILQLSHLFRLRRRRNRPQTSKSYLWELKALAIREKKTYVLQAPEMKEYPVSIYLDFEGLPESDFIYLASLIICQPEKESQIFSFWAKNTDDEKNIFIQLLDLLQRYPDASIFHYGSYEAKAVRKWKAMDKEAFAAIENRMFNLLSWFRTHVYPPTCTNGLKEVGEFLGFAWRDGKVTGLDSIIWRKNWEAGKGEEWKEKLIRYNLDDCHALIKVHEWLKQLSAGADKNDVQQVSAMKKHSPYRLQNNTEYGEDFQFISKAAYFDYQRSRIYWRNEKKPQPKKKEPIHFGRGHPVWQPGKVNEIIQIPPLQKCPHCGFHKLYHAARQRTFRQTDLKFTASGIRQWVIEYHSGKGKCARCATKYNDSVLRQLNFGDNLFAWSVNMYVNYHISFAMISRLLREQFGIWANPTYFNDRNYQWWQKFKPEVDYCWQIIRNSPVIHIDETTVRLAKGKDRGYVWAFTTSHTVFYHLTLNREAGFLQDWLKDYNGTIVTDFFPGYESLPVRQQKCLIHLIRDLNDELFKNPFDEEYKRMVTAFGHLLKKIILTINRFGLKKHYLKKHLKDTTRFYKDFVEPGQHSELSVKYGKRLKKHWDVLWTFLLYDGIPWNNNNAEAAIKAFAQHRRSVNGQVSDTGLKEYLSMLTIAQTCRYRNISFLDYLRRRAGIWQNIPPGQLPAYLPAEQTKVFAQKLNFKTREEWKAWNESGKRPCFISPEYFFIKQSVNIK